MSTKRFGYYNEPACSAVTAWEFSKATLKAAFQMAITAPGDHVGYNAFHGLHVTTQNLYNRFKGDIPSWQDPRDGLHRARIDCLHIIQGKILSRSSTGMERLDLMTTLHNFFGCAGSEFRFRHTLDYFNDKGTQQSLAKIVPILPGLTRELAKVDLNTILAARAEIAARAAKTGLNPSP